MPPLPPILSNYARDPDGLHGSVQVSQVEPGDLCAVFGIELKPTHVDLLFTMLALRQGSGFYPLSFQYLGSAPVLILATAINAQGEGTFSETAQGPLPRIGSHLMPRRAPEIVRR